MHGDPRVREGRGCRGPQGPRRGGPGWGEGRPANTSCDLQMQRGRDSSSSCLSTGENYEKIKTPKCPKQPEPLGAIKAAFRTHARPQQPSHRAKAPGFLSRVAPLLRPAGASGAAWLPWPERPRGNRTERTQAEPNQAPNDLGIFLVTLRTFPSRNLLRLGEQRPSLESVHTPGFPARPADRTIFKGPRALPATFQQSDDSRRGNAAQMCNHHGKELDAAVSVGSRAEGPYLSEHRDKVSGTFSACPHTRETVDVL